MHDATGRKAPRWRLAVILLLGLPGALLALALTIAIIGLLLRDPIVNSEPVRKEISLALRELTGRDITIRGEIDIDEFPWITVVVGPGSFGNPPGFEGPPLLTWEEIRLRVHYSTLYEASPLLDRIIITGLVVDARRDRAGRDNFSDIGPIEPTGPPEAALAMPAIELRNARIRYTDETQSATPVAALDGLSMVVEEISRGAGVVEGAHWRIGNVSLNGSARVTLPDAQTPGEPSARGEPSAKGDPGTSFAGPLALRIRDIDARIPDEGDSTVDVAAIELDYDALRARLNALKIRPPALEASVRLEPIALDRLLRVAGVEPTFRSRAQLLQLHEFAVLARFDGQLLRLDDIALQIDNSRIRGGLLLDDPVRLAIEIDTIDFEKYTPAFGGESSYDPEAPLAFPGRLLQDLPLDGQIRFGQIRARGANLTGVTLRLETRPKRASPPR